MSASFAPARVHADTAPAQLPDDDRVVFGNLLLAAGRETDVPGPGDQGKPEATPPSFQKAPPLRGTSARASSARPGLILGLGFSVPSG